MSNKSITLRDFLKKYTSIPNKFIDTYYIFYDLCEHNIFGIRDEDIIKYLGITDTKKFRRRIKSQFTEGIDYMVQEELKGKWFANTIFTTFDCFEKLCLMSKTARGNEVRDYVQTLRKFIDYYKDHIDHKINDLTVDHNYIYIILVNKGKNIFKVGVTRNMRKRLYAYSTGLEKHPDIQFIMIIDNPKVVEKCVKTFGSNYLYKQGKELYKIEI